MPQLNSVYDLVEFLTSATYWDVMVPVLLSCFAIGLVWGHIDSTRT